MLKLMAATGAGAAVSAVAAPSALAATNPVVPAPGSFLGTLHPASPSGPRLALPVATPGTTYRTFAGSDFDPGSSAQTWSDNVNGRSITNGGFSVRRLDIPQGGVITECVFVVTTPSTTNTCNLVSSDVANNAGAVFGTATSLATAGPQNVVLTVTPTTVDNTGFWYVLDYEAGSSTDSTLYGARVGWIHEPGLTLFPNPRRIVSGDTTPFTAGGTYGSFDATKKSDGTTPSGIPAGASAAFCAVQSYTPGVLTLFPDGTVDPGIANYSGTGTSGGGLNMVYMMVPLSAAARFKIHSYITGKVYVDAWGYAS